MNDTSAHAFRESMRGIGETPEESDEIDCRSYGHVRGIRDRVEAIEFKLLQGRSPALDYHIMAVSWWGQTDKEQEIVLQFGDLARVTITGRNLRPMYELILRRRVIWVKEEGPERLADPKAQGQSRVYRIVPDFGEES